MNISEITALNEGKSIIGESPIWDAINRRCYWIDNQKPILHCFDAVSAKYSMMKLPAPLRCIDLNPDNKLVAVMENQLIEIDPFSQTIIIILSKIVEKETLFNDGKFDALGRFWVGSMDPEMISPIGNLYCIDENLQVHIKENDIILCNGPKWSPDNKILYYADTTKRTIYKYNFCLADGIISHKEIFVQLSEDTGYPDGLYVDNEGYVWSAHWGGFRVTRYNPDGLVDDVIRIPARNVTCCCIGENKLFVTTANFDIQGYQDLGPNAGCLFIVTLNNTK